MDAKGSSSVVAQLQLRLQQSKQRKHYFFGHTHTYTKGLWKEKKEGRKLKQEKKRRRVLRKKKKRKLRGGFCAPRTKEKNEKNKES